MGRPYVGKGGKGRRHGGGKGGKRGGKGLHGGGGGKGGKGGKSGKGGKGGYDWQKHLPLDHPLRQTAGMGHEERTALQSDPAFQAQRDEYRENRAHKKATQDAQLLEAAGMGGLVRSGGKK